MATKKIIADLEISGTVQSPTLYLGSTSSYLRTVTGDTELYAEAGLALQSADGMIIEISDVIDIQGGGDITSDSAFTAQSLIKAGGTSSQFLKANGTVDSNTYLTSADVTDSQWDDVTGGINYASGNVGIGTTSPSEKLEVNGNIKATDIEATDEIFWGSNSSSPVGKLYSGGQTAVILNTSTDGLVQIAGGNTTSNGGNIGLFGSTNAEPSIIRFRIGGSEAMRIASNNNIGIGTTDPQEKLDISAGDIRLDDQYSINWASDDANIGRVRITGNETPDTFLIVTDNQERFRVNNSGVGIGTNDPQAKLDVDGGIKMANDTQTPASTNVGTMRYYADAFGSYADMIMQTDTTTYGWVNIVRNTFSV